MKLDEFIESRVEMEQFLNEEVLGYLGLSLGGQPYVVPLNYTYRQGKILFHCALTGQKLEAIRQNAKVCFTVARQTGQVQDHDGGPQCHPDSISVVCYGRARIVEDLAERAAVLNAFNRRYKPEAPDLAPERVQKCLAVEITVERMTGRQEQGKRCTFWRAVLQ